MRRSSGDGDDTIMVNHVESLISSGFSSCQYHHEPDSDMMVSSFAQPSCIFDTIKNPINNENYLTGLSQVINIIDAPTR